MHHRVEAAVLRTRERASSPGCRRRFRASRGVEVKGRGITFVIVVDPAPVSPHSKLSFERVQLVPHWGSYEVDSSCQFRQFARSMDGNVTFENYSSRICKRFFARF